MLWGSDLLLRPQALSAGWSPATVVLGEHLLLTLVLGPVLWRERKALARLNVRQWWALLFISWGGSALATWLYTQAFTLDFSHALTVVLLQKTQPLIAIALAGWLLGERRTPLFWVWGAAALAGAYLLIGLEKAPALADVRMEQALLALGAAALWGAATVAGRSLASALSPVLMAGARFALALPPLALLALAFPGHPASLGHVASHALPFLVLIVLLPDLAGMILYYRGLRGTTASVATLAELCYPLTALLIGLFVQHTPVNAGQWVGLALLLAAVLGLSRRPDAVRAQGVPSELSVVAS